MFHVPVAWFLWGKARSFAVFFFDRPSVKHVSWPTRSYLKCHYLLHWNFSVQ